MERPFPPGRYPVVVVGSGPGGLQLSYFLHRLGVDHAVLSEDPGPGGMFLRYPLFQRLNTWSKPHAPAERGTRPYEWYDWNSLVGDVPEHRSTVSESMDGVSYFPARNEMCRGLATFTARAHVQVRYGCRWEATRREESGFTLRTSDGEYQCRLAVFAVGMAQPWKPPIPGLEDAPHYVETKPAREYAGKRVFIIGKRNSGFEIADALLPWAQRIMLGSPRPSIISILHSGAGVRAKYLVPFEDHVMGGGVAVLDASIERVQRDGAIWRVFTSGPALGPMPFEVDAVIAATGFTSPLGDLPALGVATFNHGRLPRLTHYWESATMPGIYFAGTITQAAPGLRKHGAGGNSAAVGGFRHNARVLAHHLAREHFGIHPPAATLQQDAVVSYLLSEVTRAPELWNQQAYLARVVCVDRERGVFDDGIQPLAAFVDTPGPDAVAVSVEVNAKGEMHPGVYVRRDGHTSEHVLSGDPLLNFERDRHRAEMESVLKELVAAG